MRKIHLAVALGFCVALSNAFGEVQSKSTLSQDLEAAGFGKDIIIQTDAAFGVGKTIPTASTVKQIAKIAAVLRRHPEATVLVEGYTDTSGEKSANLKLSNARALSIQKILIDHGVDAEGVSAAGFGSERPVQSNASAEGRSANRRVELHIQ